MLRPTFLNRERPFLLIRLWKQEKIFAQFFFLARTGTGCQFARLEKTRITTQDEHHFNGRNISWMIVLITVGDKKVWAGNIYINYSFKYLHHSCFKSEDVSNRPSMINSSIFSATWFQFAKRGLCTFRNKPHESTSFAYFRDSVTWSNLNFSSCVGSSVLKLFILVTVSKRVLFKLFGRQAISESAFFVKIATERIFKIQMPSFVFKKVGFTIGKPERSFHFGLCSPIFT